MELDGLEAIIRRAMRDEIGGMFETLQRFVDRRIAEVSTEVHATVQMVDFSEANLSGQLARMAEQIASVIAAPAAGRHDSGIELQAIVQETEIAANRIMEAAEAIDEWVRNGGGDEAGRAAISARIGTIFEACSFQDLTSQRVRRAIGHLEKVEAMLEGMAPPGRVAPPPGAPGLEQAAIDLLMAG